MSETEDPFRERLRRKLGTARAASLAPAEPPREPPAGPSSAEAARALERLLGRRAKRAGERARERAESATHTSAMAPSAAPRELPPELLVRANARGEFAECVRHLADDAMRAALERLQSNGTEVLVTHAHQAGLDAPFALERAAFLDTETTALHGGAGCTVFLIGLGFVEAGALRVHQVFLRSPGDECAALERVAELLAAADVLVSFHGKSFDRHRLHARFGMNGFASPLLSLPHVDLCHIARRFYRGCFPDARLQTLEREVLAIRREDDLPGSLCPQAWFAHVAGRPSRIGDVFEHNLLDVGSLARLGARFAVPPDERASAREWLSLARGHRLRGRREEARAALQCALAKLDVESADYLRAKDEERLIDPRRRTRAQEQRNA